MLHSDLGVREAAVVGVPHEFRSDSVKAFVSLQDCVTADLDELIACWKERMSAFCPPGRPRSSMPPKNAAGTILRRELC